MMTDRIHIAWDNKAKTVVLQTFEIAATTADIFKMARLSAEMLSTVDHTVHLIIVRKARLPIVNARDLNHLSSHVPANQGHVLVVGTAHDKLLIEMGEKSNSRAVQDSLVVNSLQEARQYLIDHLSVVYP
ncbi:MAG: hypothetical protein KC615_22430 [Anaerolineae bacterium]|nr:hypothetical protein [Anaerolineae bacterium]